MFYLAKKKDVDAKNKYEDKQKKRRQLLGKLKLDRHHKMERFTIIVGTLAVGFALNLSVSGVHAFKSTRQVLSDQAMYTETAAFSLTQTNVTVNGVYRSADKKTAFVVYTIDNVDTLSLDGKTYDIYIMGYKDKIKSQTLNARYFVFGGTGLMGMMIYDQNGLPNQILDIVVRANKKVADYQAGAADGGDVTFSKYNQMRLYVNPGAKNAIKMPQLGTDINKELLYYLFVGEKQETPLLDQYKESKRQERLLYDKIDEYKERIKSAGYELPDAPEWAKRDYRLPKGFMLEDDLTMNPDHGKTTYMKAWYDGDVDAYRLGVNDLEAEHQEIVENLKLDYEAPSSLISKKGSVLDINEVSDDGTNPTEAQLMRDFNSLLDSWNSLLDYKQEQQYTIPLSLLQIEATQKNEAKHFSWGDGKNVYVDVSK